MNSNSWSEFWWANITGAHLVISKIVEALTENCTVIIDIPVDLPWRHQMRSSAEDEFRKLSGISDTIIEVVDATDDVPVDVAPGRFLLDRFAQNKEVRNGYRERSQRSIQEYIIENTVLKNRIIWVKGMLNSQVSDWLSFCRDYNSNNEENGLFVLEIQGGVHKQDNNMRSIRLLECISNYDVQLFSSFIVEEKSALSNVWRRYLSTATAIICDIDAEIASHLLEIIDPKKQSPLDIIMEMASWQEYSVRGADDESNHIFMHCRNNNKKELEQRLWKAQVQVLFPLIEMERIKIIESYYRELQTTIEQKHIEQYGEKITKPIQLELGTLCFLMNRYSCIRDKDARERISFLHKCRNHLAHAHCCSTSEVCELLDYRFL
jgi:hypothetical protein